MSLNVEQWRARPTIVDAVLVTADNARECDEWCRSNALHDSPLPLADWTGWWCVRIADGEFRMLPDEEFRALYEPRHPDVPRGWRERAATRMVIEGIGGQ